jgi:NhaA family Na+:H+ antiporter
MLHPWVAYGILPVFAFANAGLPLLGLALDQFVGTVPLGIILGLVAGKPIGVLAGAAVALALFRVRLPAETTPKMLIGMAVLTGIGFTMSLFIGSLAFDSVAQSNAVRLGVLFGSLVSALIGSLVLLAASAKTPPQATCG